MKNPASKLSLPMVAAFCVMTLPAVTTAQNPDLSGTWILNSNSGSPDTISSSGFHFSQVGDISIQASVDIVGGNKTTIITIQQKAQKIVKAPYKFLASYDISDRDIFFGRTAVIEELAGKIEGYRCPNGAMRLEDVEA